MQASECVLAAAEPFNLLFFSPLPNLQKKGSFLNSHFFWKKNIFNICSKPVKATAQRCEKWQVSRYAKAGRLCFWGSYAFLEEFGCLWFKQENLTIPKITPPRIPFLEFSYVLPCCKENHSQRHDVKRPSFVIPGTDFAAVTSVRKGQHDKTGRSYPLFSIL